MLAFFIAHWAEIVLTLVTTGSIALFKYLFGRIKKYKALIKDQEKEGIEELIQEKLISIVDEIEELREYIRKTSNKEVEHINLIISSYRYRLVQLCRLYLKQKYMTQDQFEQLTEFYRVYTGLGGNGQAKEYYEKVMQLPIITQEEGSN